MMETLIILTFTIIYLGVGFLSSLAVEIMYFMARVEEVKAKNKLYDKYPLRSLKKRLKGVILWPFYFRRYLVRGLY